MIVSGTHGFEGLSGLSEEGFLDHGTYSEDCNWVGVEAGFRRARGLPLMSWEGLPTVNKPAERMEPPPPGSFYADEDLKEMDFRLANMAYYFGNSQKLIDDINEVKLKEIVKNILFHLKYFLSLNQTS